LQIGILTFQDTTNYGACLQCFALTKYINNLGYKCETIQYFCKEIKKREFGLRLFSNGIIKLPITLISYIFKMKKRELIKHFLKTNCLMSQRKYNSKNIKKSNEIYDLFISGSDIIWELNVTGGDYNYYLAFVEDNGKKFAYSSSFGYETIPSIFAEKSIFYLRQYKRISTRENSGADLLYNYLKERPIVTLDPTLLFSADEWLKYEEAMDIEKKYIFLYFDDDKHITLNFAKKLADEKKMPIVFLNDSVRKNKYCINVKNVTVGQFIWLIHNAEYVITGSYHGVLFSINFHKEFYYYNRNHPGRINTIMSNLNILGREITDSQITKLDWEKIDANLQNLRNESYLYLEGILNDE
jgi:hypothetical protein